MDLRSLKILFEDGGLSAAEAVKDTDNGRAIWLLRFRRRNGDVAVIGTAKQPETAKIFRSLDAVQSAAEEVGFEGFSANWVKSEKVQKPEDFELKRQ